MKSFKLPLHMDMQELLIESQSQAGQDLFVVAMTEGKKNGTYLEIGAGHPIIGNNTFLLEKKFNYAGVSIDKYDEHELSIRHPYWAGMPKWKDVRPKSQFIATDARNIDYPKLGTHFDYLSFDLDHPLLSWDVITQITNNIEFSVITFEHDIWTNATDSKILKNRTFTLLRRLGYELLVDNVTIEPGKGSGINDDPIYFEDWYVNPKYIRKEVIDAYKWVTLDFTIKYYPDILFS